MVPPGSELDSYLVHRILIVDGDTDERDRLAGVLASIKGVAPDETFDQASVNSVRKARDFIEAKTPSVIIIDPEIASTDEILSFIEETRTAHPTIIWVINSKPHWWSDNAKAIQEHPFGGRVKEYYRRTKSPKPDEAKRSFLVTLAQCQADFVLQLLDKTATEIETELVNNMTDEQVRKFVTKAIRPLLSLLAKDHNRLPQTGKIAFVSMPFTDRCTNLYRLVIEPTLEMAGFEPRMMEQEYRDELIPVAILGDIARSSLFVVEMTERRPDVMIELGAALIAKIPVILLAHRELVQDSEIPFIVRNVRIERYTSEVDLQAKLKSAIANPCVPFS